ncbi:MAG: hypothetical protein ACRD22_21900, partial [Terriglobia bacterium]
MASTSATQPHGFHLPHDPTQVEEVLDDGFKNMEFAWETVQNEVGVNDPTTRLEWDPHEYHTRIEDNWNAIERAIDALSAPAPEVPQSPVGIPMGGAPSPVQYGSGTVFPVNGNPSVKGIGFYIATSGAYTPSDTVYFFLLDNPALCYPLLSKPRTPLVSLGCYIDTLVGVDADGMI